MRHQMAQHGKGFRRQAYHLRPLPELFCPQVKVTWPKMPAASLHGVPLPSSPPCARRPTIERSSNLSEICKRSYGDLISTSSMPRRLRGIILAQKATGRIAPVLPRGGNIRLVENGL